MIKTLRKWFVGEEVKVKNTIEPEQSEYRYICLRLDPKNTINKLEPDNPTWNMRKVEEGLISGMLRYATRQEVADAIREGRLKT